MPVAADDGTVMLPCECGDPKIVAWDGLPSGFKFASDIRIMSGCRQLDHQDLKESQIRVEPTFVFCAHTRLADAVQILAQYNHRYVELDTVPNYGEERVVSFDERRQRVGIEDQRQSSSSIVSNSF